MSGEIPAVRPSRLLIIEDQESNRYALSRLLRREGFTVEEATTGMEGLALAATHPDLIVLDIHLPDIDGIEVRRRLKADAGLRDIPLIHLTSTYANHAHWAKALEEGADAYLTQPVEPALLLATIRSQLRVRRAELAMEAALQREKSARREAEEVNRLKDQFLATLSHELRTPLNAIVGWAHVLRSAEDDPTMVERAVDTILRNCELQTKLIEDILDVARIISGSLRLELERLDPAEVVQASLETATPAAQAKQITVESDFTSGVTLVADRRRLQQAVWNLLNNAVKFTPRGGTVRVRSEVRDDHLHLLVEDTGIGVPSNFLPYVFDRFSQADPSLTREHQGLGLGLAIVRHIAELHGGLVGAESPGPDLGSTFWIGLPLAAPEASEPAVPAADPAEPSRAVEEMPALSPLRGQRILAVDDNSESLTMLAALLESAGATALVASTPEEALRIVGEGVPDALVSDIAMPRCDGVELLQKLRSAVEERGHRLPAVAFSALAGARDRDRALRGGFDAYLTKPVEPTRLVSTLAKLVG